MKQNFCGDIFQSLKKKNF